MNVNIFLKQFKMSNEAIVTLVRDSDDARIGAEKLRGLLKVLPETDEVDFTEALSCSSERMSYRTLSYALHQRLPSVKLVGPLNGKWLADFIERWKASA